MVRGQGSVRGGSGPQRMWSPRMKNEASFRLFQHPLSFRYLLRKPRLHAGCENVVWTIMCWLWLVPGLWYTAVLRPEFSPNMKAKIRLTNKSEWNGDLKSPIFYLYFFQVENKVIRWNNDIDVGKDDNNNHG